MHDDRVDVLHTASIVSNVLGAFELNCVGITVESPVEDLLEEVKVAARRAAGGSCAAQQQTLEVCSVRLSSCCHSTICVAWHPFQFC